MMEFSYVAHFRFSLIRMYAHAVSFHIPTSPVFLLCKLDLNTASAHRSFQAGDIINMPNARIAILGGKAFVEQHDAIISIEHQVSRVDLFHALRRGGQASIQVTILLIAVQLTHIERHGQQANKSASRGIILQLRSKNAASNA